MDDAGHLNASLPAPLFVVGAPRSGTTLMRECLRALRGVYVLSEEFQVLPSFVRAVDEDHLPIDELTDHLASSAFALHMKARQLWPSDDEIAAAIEGKSAADAFRNFVLLFASLEESDTNHLRFFGDKTPHNVRYLDRIGLLWPTVRVINVVRDPRDTVLSMHRAWGRSMARGATIWRDSVRSVECFEVSKPSGASVMTVAYEDLTTKPTDVMKRLGEWLSTDVDVSRMASVNTRERWGKAAGEVGVRGLTSKWRDGLTNRQVARIESICYHEMQQMHYLPSVASAPFSPSVARLRVERLLDGVRAVRSYARERGGAQAVKYKVKQRSGDRRWI